MYSNFKILKIPIILIVWLHLLPQTLVLCQHDEVVEPQFNATSLFSSYPMDDHNEHSKCQPMKIPFCDKLDYNKTMLPNFLNHVSQQDIITEINVYSPLIRVNCSPDLKLFLCTVYAPMCFDEILNDSKALSLLPCRSLCESARSPSCVANLSEFNHVWPAALNCDKFPDKRANDKIHCVGREEEMSPEESNTNSENLSSVIHRDLGFVCPENFKVNSYSLHLHGKTYDNCALPCDNVLLDRNSTQIVKLMSGVLAIVCLASTVFTCITFMINTKRFKYPARPIIIIASCQLIVASCYLLGFLTNNKIACNEAAEPPKDLPNLKMVRTIASGNRKGSCTLQFMILYFFQMSTMLWWLMMTISWDMIARLKWAPEAVSNVARYFHLISWTVSALLTVYLSVIGNIEGDPLSGTCYVSTSDQESIRLFVVYPTLTCIVLGCLFLVSGFKSIWDSREILRREYGKQTNEHYKLVIRIGLFSILFIGSSTLFMYSLSYEQSNLNKWMLAWLSRICTNRDYSIPCPTKDFSNYGPHFSTLLMKYVATMAIGIISALFMLSERTFNSYKEMAELCNLKFGP